MTRARTWFLVVAIAAVGLACGSDDGSSTGTGGSGGSGGRSTTGVAGRNGGAGASGAAGTTGGAGSGGGAGTGGHAGAAGGSAGTGGQAGAGGGAGVGGRAGNGGTAGNGGGAGGHAGSGGSAGGGGGHSGSGGGAGAGGSSGTGGGAGSTGVCGGVAGLTCDLGQFCAFGDGQCGAGDQQGQCDLSGGALCVQQVVCGCDGNTYSSACQAHANGVDTMSTTACIPGNGGANTPCGGDSDCMSGYKCCVTGGRAGSPIACRQVTGACPALP